MATTQESVPAAQCRRCGAALRGGNSWFCTRCGDRLAANSSNGPTPRRMMTTAAPRRGSNRTLSISLLLAGAALLVLAVSGLAIPFLTISGTHVSILQANSLCSSPFGAFASSECTPVTLGFLAAIAGGVIGIVLAAIAVVRLTASHESEGPSADRPVVVAAAADAGPMARDAGGASASAEPAPPSPTAAEACPGCARQIDGADMAFCPGCGRDLRRGATTAWMPQQMAGSALAAPPSGGQATGASTLISAFETLQSAASAAVIVLRRWAAQAVTIWREHGGGRGMVRSLQARARGLSPRARLGIGAFAGGLAFVAVALFALNYVNSPNYRLSHAVGAVADRQAPADLMDPTNVALAMGVAGAPGDVSFAVSQWSLTTENDAYSATWLLTAKRSGHVVAEKRQAAVFMLTADHHFDVNAQSGIRNPVGIGALIPEAALGSEAEARGYVDAAVEANAAFDVAVALTSATAPDQASLPPPQEVADSTRLQGEQETISEAVPAEVETWSYAVNGVDYPLYRVISKPAVPARVAVGTLDPATLIDQAMGAFAAFDAARAQDDAQGVHQAFRVLTHADGLAASGLAASTIRTPDAGVLVVTGTKGHYAVRDGSVVVAPDSHGVWRIDYAGQPLAVFSSRDRLHYDGPAPLGGSPSPVDVTMDSVTISAGQTTFDLHFSVSVQSGDRLYNDDVVVDGVKVNGVPVDGEKGSICSIRDLSGDLEVPTNCDLRAIPVPTDGLRSVSVTLEFAYAYGPTYAVKTLVAKPE